MPNVVLVAFGVVLGVGLPFGDFACGAGLSGGETAAGHDAEEVSITYLSLDEALRRSLASNPELAAQTNELRAIDSELAQAGMLPNPELSIELENFAGSGEFSDTERSETTLLISQKLELGGKRHRRIALGEADKSIANKTYSATRASLRAVTKRLFTAVLTAQQRLALATDQQALAKTALAAVNERIEAGKSPELERLRFATLLQEAGLRQEQARLELAAARNELAALWAPGEPDFDRVRGDLNRLPQIPGREELFSMVETSPGIELQKEDLSRLARKLELEQTAWFPDLTVSFGGKRVEETGDHALIAGLSVDLPIFDRNEGAIRAADARLAKAGAALRSMQLRYKRELAGLWGRLQAARAEVTMLRDSLLPIVQKSFEDIHYGYQAGKFGYLDVLEAEDVFFTARSRYVDSLKEYHFALADLEEMVGREFIGNQTEALSSVVH